MKPPVFDSSWSDEVKAVYKHDIQEIWDPTIARHVWNQYHNQLRIYLRIANGKERLNVLDIGCAQATLAILLAERGHRVWAMDIRQGFLDYAASRYERGDIRFICENVMKAEPEKRFDLIFANQIIEHVVYPKQLTRRLAAWLNPGGRLVITTPNAMYFKNSLPTFSELGDPADFADRQFSADGDGHFFSYTAEELGQIVRDAGLQRVETVFFESPFISGHMKLRYLHKLAPVVYLSFLDRLSLNIPLVGKRLAHQLMITGVHP